MCDLEEIPYHRSILNTEICHRASNLLLHIRTRGGKRTVHWSREEPVTEGCRPDERVVRAWGVQLEDLKPIPHGYDGRTVEFERWQPGPG